MTSDASSTMSQRRTRAHGLSSRTEALMQGSPPQQVTQLLTAGFIDPPSIKASLTQWLEFLSALEKWPQDNLMTKREVEHARKMVAWKQRGEKGEGPKREIPPMPKLDDRKQ